MNMPSTNSEPKRPRRSKADLVYAALGILDDQGLPDLTMRRLAEVLGVQPSALYWHFENKQSLLAAVSERILAPLSTVELNAPSLTAAATVLGSRLHDCLLSYRDGAELVSSSLALGLIEPPLREPLAMTARTLGESETLAHTAAEAITHFVVGYAFHEQQRLQADTLGLLGSAPVLTPESATGGSPEIAFDAVISLITAGIAAQAKQH